VIQSVRQLEHKWQQGGQCVWRFPLVELLVSTSRAIQRYGCRCCLWGGEISQW